MVMPAMPARLTLVRSCQPGPRWSKKSTAKYILKIKHHLSAPPLPLTLVSRLCVLLALPGGMLSFTLPVLPTRAAPPHHSFMAPQLLLQGAALMPPARAEPPRHSSMALLPQLQDAGGCTPHPTRAGPPHHSSMALLPQLQDAGGCTPHPTRAGPPRHSFMALLLPPLQGAVTSPHTRAGPPGLCRHTGRRSHLR